jgi:hypothetical protein
LLASLYIKQLSITYGKKKDPNENISTENRDIKIKGLTVI